MVLAAKLYHAKEGNDAGVDPHMRPRMAKRHVRARVSPTSIKIPPMITVFCLSLHLCLLMLPCPSRSLSRCLPLSLCLRPLSPHLSASASASPLRPPCCHPVMTAYTWAEKIESFERINSIRETNGNFDSCNSCKRLGTSRLHELHESKFPFVSRIEFIRSKLSIFSAHVYWSLLWPPVNVSDLMNCPSRAVAAAARPPQQCP